MTTLPQANEATDVLPPLPLIDNCLFVDATAFFKYITCRRSFEYYFLRKRQASGKRVPLEAGAIFHSIIEVRRRLEHKQALAEIEKLQEETCHLLYAGWDNSPGLSSRLISYLTDKHQDITNEDVAESLYPGFTPPLDDFRTESHLINVLRAYNAQYPVEPFDPLLGEDNQPVVELPFALPLVTIDASALGLSVPDITIYWTGRCDFPCHWDKELWNTDLKTSTRDGGFSEYYNDQAQIGYLWALWKLTGELPSGFMIDQVLWRAPSTKGKGIEFKRHRERISKDRIEEWEFNTIRIFEDIFHDYARGFFPMESSWCVGKYGACQYLDVCKLPPHSRPVLLESSFYEDVKWNPLREISAARV